MDNERKGRLIIAVCQLSALLVAAAMIAGQYLAVISPIPELPATGSTAAQSPLGLVERWKLKKITRAHYEQLAELGELSEEQQQKLAAIAELLGE